MTPEQMEPDAPQGDRGVEPIPASDENVVPIARVSDSHVNVLLACDRLGYDNSRLHGAGRLMIDWTRALLEQGVNVHAVILRRPGRLGRLVMEEGLPFTFLSRHPFDPRALLDFVRLIRKWDIQVLHLQAFGASTFGRMAGVVTRTPAIVHVHADYRVEPKGYPWYVKFLDRLLAPTTSVGIAISQPIARFAIEEQGLPEQQVRVIHNSLDLELFGPPSNSERLEARRCLDLGEEDRIAVCVARFDRTKGVDILAKAWKRVAAELDNVILLLVGDGPDRSRIETEIEGSAAAGSVRFLGYRDDVHIVLRGADWAVVPSRYEGLSLAALEAMATGLPVVASNIGGIPEIVSHGKSGLLVPPEDPGSLAAALVEAFSMDEPERRRYSDAALATASKHGLPATAKEFEVLYRELA